MHILRDYQSEMLERLEDAWRVHRSVMVQMPTGTGKTVLMAEVIRCEQSRAERDGCDAAPLVLIVAHRRELIAQIRDTVKAHGVDAWVTVESIQKLDHEARTAGKDEHTMPLSSRKKGRGSLSEMTPTLVIIDEAHHALAKTYRMLWDRWPNARILGLSATPCRLNGAPFTDLFDVLLQSWQIQAFIDKGWLSDFEYVSAAPDSRMLSQVAALRKRGADGDYQQKEMATVMDVPESIAHLYATYEQFAHGRKGIVYAIDRSHASHIADYYKQKGVNCEVIDANTPSAFRQEMVKRYGQGELDVLINVDIFSEGYDCPEVEFIQLARPTLSLSKYLQQVGRGMRVSEGKEAVLILDNVGLYQTFGLPTEERDWQEMFAGLLSGKGVPGKARPVVVKDDMDEEKILVNLEMVRIRRRNESMEGLEIYLQNGKYGVMKDGKVTTQPVFERVRRCESDLCFALATYPYAFFRNRTTVIDMNGADQMVQLYGRIELRGEFLYGLDMSGNRVLWDLIGKKYYKGHEPKFEHIGGLDILRSDQQPTETPNYELRYSRGMQSLSFSKGEVYFNNYIAIIRDVLILKDGGFRFYKILGYMDDSILILTNKAYSSIQVSWDGHFMRRFSHLPQNFSFRPNFHKLKLERVN